MRTGCPGFEAPARERRQGAPEAGAREPGQAQRRPTGIPLEGLGGARSHSKTEGAPNIPF